MARKTSFYYSFLALPPAERRAITAFFDFCRGVDDAVDLEPDARRAALAIDEWRREVDRMYSGGAPATAEGRALQPFIEPFHLPRAQIEALVDGVAMDIAPGRYQTFAELEPYCHRVASAVGLVCAEIFGYRDRRSLDYARDLGVALQLTNILRDVGVDYLRGRVYLPVEDLARFGCTDEHIARAVAAPGRGLRDEPLRRVLAHHASRAHEFFARAVDALPGQDAPRFVAAEVMRAIYQNLLRRIEAARYDVFGDLVRVPRPAQARIALATWWRTRGRSARAAVPEPRG
jgi:phytoene synthase